MTSPVPPLLGLPPGLLAPPAPRSGLELDQLARLRAVELELHRLVAGRADLDRDRFVVLDVEARREGDLLAVAEGLRGLRRGGERDGGALGAGAATGAALGAALGGAATTAAVAGGWASFVFGLSLAAPIPPTMKITATSPTAATAPAIQTTVGHDFRCVCGVAGTIAPAA